MKKVLLTLLSSSLIYASSINCNVKKELTTISSVDISFARSIKVEIDSFDEFQFLVSKLDNDYYEIEVYDKNQPSRSYSKGKLSNSGESLNWTLWTRDYLLEVECIRK